MKHESGRLGDRLESTRQRMEACRRAANVDAEACKDSMLVLDRLRHLYAGLDVDQRSAASEVLLGWLRSDDEASRYDALALVEEFRVLEASPALRALASRLGATHAPGASYERRKIERILEALGPSSGVT